MDISVLTDARSRQTMWTARLSPRRSYTTKGLGVSTKQDGMSTLIRGLGDVEPKKRTLVLRRRDATAIYFPVYGLSRFQVINLP